MKVCIFIGNIGNVLGEKKVSLNLTYLHSHYFSLRIPYLYYKEDLRAHYIKFFKRHEIRDGR